MAAQVAFSVRAYIVKTLANMLRVPVQQTRGFTAASWKRFPPEAVVNRFSIEALQARARVAQRGGFYAESDTYAHAGVAAAVTYAWGAGAVVAHPDAERFAEWGRDCDADGVLTFDAMVALAIREVVVSGEALFVFVGDKVRLLPASQLDESKSADLGNGSRIDAGIETDSSGRPVAYWLLPSLPSTQFESFAPSVRIDAQDVVHLFRPLRVGQTRGLSWLAPAMLKIADVNLLVDALTNGARTSALASVYFTNKNETGNLPFQGEKIDDRTEFAPEPGAARVIPGNWEVTAFTPQYAQQSLEFLHAQVNAIAAALGVCAFMVSGDMKRANYSSLRADLLKMKAHTEAWQYLTLVPALNKIWTRWGLLESLRGADIDSALPKWRFAKFPDADPIKAVQAVREAMAAKITSRREAIEERGEEPDVVTAEIQSDPFPEAYTTGAVAAPADESEETDETDSNTQEDSNANP